MSTTLATLQLRAVELRSGYRVTSDGRLMGTASLTVDRGKPAAGSSASDSQGLAHSGRLQSNRHLHLHRDRHRLVFASGRGIGYHRSAVVCQLPASMSRTLLPSDYPVELGLSAGPSVAYGGHSAYSFADSGPRVLSAPGLDPIDPSTGQISGTPTTSGSYSSSRSRRATQVRLPDERCARPFRRMSVAPPLGRNDSPATATRVGNGTFQASISPFTDSPNVCHSRHGLLPHSRRCGGTRYTRRNLREALLYAGNPLDTVSGDHRFRTELS